MSDMKKVDEVNLTAAEKLAQLEKEKLTRRQALARFGFQAGAAAVAALTADDLLRKVGNEMRKRAGDNKIAQQVAKELQQAGLANATPTCAEDEEWDSEIEFCVGTTCEKCAQTLDNWLSTGGPGGPGVCWTLYSDDPALRANCYKKAYTAWCKCMKNNNCPGKPTIPQCSACTSTGC